MTSLASLREGPNRPRAGPGWQAWLAEEAGLAGLEVGLAGAEPDRA